MDRKEPVTVAWEEKKTDETRRIEAALRGKFPKTDAYRFNSGSIRVRVVDERFRGKSVEHREKMVLPLLQRLPENTQADVMILLTLAPEETESLNGRGLVNAEFENPSRPML
jgi:stress-induced morphogen